jgi:3'-phosphoadenosine 5'-phosphosulfate sulfotransferase (PAPS reductase)/FAD synthetase
MTKEDLQKMQAWTLERKIEVTQTRIMEWYERHEGRVFVSLSGGKDSTVLLDLARRCYPDIEAAFVDTGLEFPEVRAFAMSLPNVTVLKPDMNFREVLDVHGWCYPSKDTALTLYYARQGSKWAVDRLHGVNDDGSPSKYRKSHYSQWAFLLDAPVKISASCCAEMKEKPLNRYAKQSGKFAIIGTMAAESHRREQAWLKTGCNAMSGKRPMSKPLSFWTEQDILRYIRDFNIPYASVYGDIVERDGKLTTTGETRTGCVFCPIACHHDKQNRWLRLAQTHSQLYDYCINKLNLRALLDYVGVDY